MHTDNDWQLRLRPVSKSEVGLQNDRVVGMAIVFNELSHDLGGFRERILPSAVDRNLRTGRNVDALVDHDKSSLGIIGSTAAGTLKQFKESRGLRVEVTPPNTTRGRDLVEQLSVGHMRGMSFRFRAKVFDGMRVAKGETSPEGLPIVEVFDMEYSEVSFLHNPAYPQTSAHLRALEIDQEVLRELMRDATGTEWKPSLKLRARMARSGAR